MFVMVMLAEGWGPAMSIVTCVANMLPDRLLKTGRCPITDCYRSPANAPLAATLPDRTAAER